MRSLESWDSSSRASTASRALRLRERSRERKSVRASCWVIVLAPSVPPARAQVVRERAGDGYRIDAMMAEKPVILDGHDRRAQRRGNALERDLPAPRVEREPRACPPASRKTLSDGPRARRRMAAAWE